MIGKSNQIKYNEMRVKERINTQKRCESDWGESEEEEEEGEGEELGSKSKKRLD